MKILAFESSCDETAAAVVENGRVILSDIVLSQIDIHHRYGGVVPEIASRAHTEAIVDVSRRALEQASLSVKDVDAIAVTNRPGLIGALLVGVNFAKSLAFAAGKPIVPVNHIEGHIAALYLAHPDLEPPFLALVMSGGHTSLVEVKGYTAFSLIGATRDDAAGEAFDKAGRVIGIGYPGGKEMDRLAAIGDKTAIPFPSAAIRDHDFDFTFSGLKTAVINYVHNKNQTGESIVPQDLAASFTDAVCRGIASRLENAFRAYPHKKLVLAGGVAANSHIRKTAQSVCESCGATLYLPPLSLCGDNGAMIAAQGYYNFMAGMVGDESLNAYATSPFNFKF